MGIFFDSDSFVEVGFFIGHFKDCFFDLVELFDDFVEHGFGVVDLFTDEDVSHAVGDELKAFHIVFVLVKSSDIILEINFRFPSLTLNLSKQEIDVSVSPFLDLTSDVDVCYEGPGHKEIAKELLEYFFGDYGLARWYDHLERNTGFSAVVLPFQDVHVFYEILEPYLHYYGQIRGCRYQCRRR